MLTSTIQDLTRIGLKPEIITVQDGSPSQAANRRNAHSALTKAYDGNPVLILEDDVRFNEHLKGWIKWLESNANSVTTLYACVGKFYPSHIRPFVERSEVLPVHLHGLHKLEGLRGFYGSQAVWIPARVADDMVNDNLFKVHEHPPYGPWDHAIRSHLQARDDIMSVVVPNLVQHKAPSSVVNRTGPRHTTPIFDQAVRPPEGE